jgi:hypothetical protein
MAEIMTLEAREFFVVVGYLVHCRCLAKSLASIYQVPVATILPV